MQNPVAATAEEVAAEVAAVRAAARTACPLQVALERVVVTSGGTIMAAWQVLLLHAPSILEVHCYRLDFKRNTSERFA